MPSFNPDPFQYLRRRAVGGPTFFAPSGTVYDFTSTLPAAVTYSRTGAATAFTSTGVVQSFAANAPQLTDRGLLLETARTNLFLRSQEFDNASWTKQSSTITANATLAPDGTTTADRITESANTTSHQVSQLIAGLSSGATVTYEVFAKQDTRRYLQIGAVSGPDFPWAVFDLQAGAVTQSGATAGATLASASIAQAANGFYRCTLVGSIAGATAAQARILMANAPTPGVGPISGGVGYLGDGTSSLFLWQADAQTGATSSSPIATTTATATRGLPSATLTAPSANWSATYGLSNTLVTGTATPGASFDLVTGRAWIGLGNELKALAFS